MKNAVERLWPAVAAGDRYRAATELHDHVVVEWPHVHQRIEGREAYLEALEQVPGIRALELRRVVTQGRHVASQIHVADAAAGAWAVGSFFTLHDGRILHATEYWVRTA